jgi:hypothetical protein
VVNCLTLLAHPDPVNLNHKIIYLRFNLDQEEINNEKTQNSQNQVNILKKINAINNIINDESGNNKINTQTSLKILYKIIQIKARLYKNLVSLQPEWFSL